MKTVEFHRHFKRFQGGHLKVFHYFGHVRSAPGFQARVRFTPESVWDESNPWLTLRECVLAPDERIEPDVLFLAGMDWRALEPAARARSPVPIFNLIQGFRHLRQANPAHEFLAHRAIRLCVSPELEQALREHDPPVPGPIFTVPVGLDLDALPRARSAHERDLDCLVLAVKDPEAGAALARSLQRERRRVRLVERPLARAELLEAMARARVVAHLPVAVEGAYMPALESMALGAAVVCPDCVGNRSFCRDGDTCFVPAREPQAMLEAIGDALAQEPAAHEALLERARQESARHALALERERFLALLGRARELWGEGG